MVKAKRNFKQLAKLALLLYIGKGKRGGKIKWEERKAKTKREKTNRRAD